MEDKDENDNQILSYMPKYKLNLRQPNLSIEMSHVFGIDCYKRSSVAFWGDL